MVRRLFKKIHPLGLHSLMFALQCLLQLASYFLSRLSKFDESELFIFFQNSQWFSPLPSAVAWRILGCLPPALPCRVSRWEVLARQALKITWQDSTSASHASPLILVTHDCRGVKHLVSYLGSTYVKLQSCESSRTMSAQTISETLP